MKRRGPLAQRERGFTLIELLVALAITGLIISAIAMTTFQTFKINQTNSNAIVTQRMVQQVGAAMSTDGLQARTIVDGNNSSHDSPPDTNAFAWPIKYSFIDLSGNTHLVTYSLAGGVLTRSEKIGTSAPTTTTVASAITAAVFTRIGSGYYQLTVTSSLTAMTTVTETRTYEILLRIAT